MYVNGRQVVVNSGVQLTSCGTIDLSVAKHSVLFKYIHEGGFANASVSYRIKRSEQEDQLPLLPLESVSPGWCAATFDSRTTCFGSPATNLCRITYPVSTSGGDVVADWSIAVALQAPLKVCAYVSVCMHACMFVCWYRHV